MAEQAGDGMAVVDVMGRVVYANRTFQSLVGMGGRSAPVGSPLTRWVDADGARHVVSRLSGPAVRRETFLSEFRVRAKGLAGKVLEVCATVLPSSEAGPSCALVCRDITRRKQSEEALRGLPRRIREIQEAERRRVARELHDGVVQILSSVKFRFQSIEEQLTTLNEAVQVEVGRAGSLLEKAIHEVRRISQNLRPSELDDLGLAAAIRSLCQAFREETGIQVRCVLGRLEFVLPSEAELGIYRIVQEALSNVARHASATRASVRCCATGSVLDVSIRDNGRGFDAARFRRLSGRLSGMGLVDIQERAQMLGGQCTIESRPGAGTAILLQLPLSPRPTEPSANSHSCEQGRST